MMNNYNPYTVPENFFEDVSRQAVAECRRRHRVAGYVAAAVVALLVIPAAIHFVGGETEQQQVAKNSLAELYEYDIFLQVNF